MTTPGPGLRNSQQRAQDEQIASKSPLPPLGLPPDAVSSPVEEHLDPDVRLPEHSAGGRDSGAT